MTLTYQQQQALIQEKMLQLERLRAEEKKLVQQIRQLYQQATKK